MPVLSSFFLYLMLALYGSSFVQVRNNYHYICAKGSFGVFGWLITIAAVRASRQMGLSNSVVGPEFLTPSNQSVIPALCDCFDVWVFLILAPRLHDLTPDYESLRGPLPRLEWLLPS